MHTHTLCTYYAGIQTDRQTRRHTLTQINYLTLGDASPSRIIGANLSKINVSIPLARFQGLMIHVLSSPLCVFMTTVNETQ